LRFFPRYLCQAYISHLRNLAVLTEGNQMSGARPSPCPLLHIKISHTFILNKNDWMPSLYLLGLGGGILQNFLLNKEIIMTCSFWE